MGVALHIRRSGQSPAAFGCPIHSPFTLSVAPRQQQTPQMNRGRRCPGCLRPTAVLKMSPWSLEVGWEFHCNLTMHKLCQQRYGLSQCRREHRLMGRLEWLPLLFRQAAEGSRTSPTVNQLLRMTAVTSEYHAAMSEYSHCLE